jgi:hypothetical protein
MAFSYQRTFGQFVLEAHDSGNRVDTDFADSLDNIQKTRFPLAAFSFKSKNSKQKDTSKFVLFEEDLIPRTGTATKTVATTGSTTGAITGDSLRGIVVGSVIHFPAAWTSASVATAGDIAYVSALTTSKATVRRITTTEGQIADNSTFVICGNVDTEISTSGPAAFDVEPSSVTGYMQILKRRIDFSKTELRSKVRGAADRQAEKLNRAKMDFMLDAEHFYWFSRATNDSTNSLRYSMGIIPQIAGATGSVKIDAGANDLALGDIGDAVAKTAKDSASDNYTVFHGGQGMAGLWELEMGKLESRTGETKFGMYATTVNAPGGMTLNFVFARVFDVIGAPYSKMLVGLDLSRIAPVHLEGGLPVLERDVHSDPSGEYVSHQWRAQCGIGVTWPRRHWITYDVVNYT